MKIDFKNNFLKKCANDDSFRLKKIGKINGKIYKQRLDELASSESLENIRYLPGNYHELSQDRKGTWSVNLEQPYRLIFEPQENPIPTDNFGKYIWGEIKAVTILNIVDYH